MKTFKRKDITTDDYQEIFKRESHHDHEIIEDDNGTLRWKENPIVREMTGHGNPISLNDLLPMLCSMGYGKNSEVYRKLYRDMGYSLFGYWEIFYWDWNNEEWDEYRKDEI